MGAELESPSKPNSWTHLCGLASPLGMYPQLASDEREHSYGHNRAGGAGLACS